MQTPITILNDEIAEKKLKIDELDIAYTEKSEIYARDLKAKETQLAAIDGQIENKGQIKVSLFESVKFLDVEIAEKTAEKLELDKKMAMAQQELLDIKAEAEREKSQAAQTTIEAKNILVEANKKELSIKERELSVTSKESRIVEREKSDKIRSDTISNQETSLSVRESQLAVRESATAEARQNVERRERENNSLQIKTKEALAEADKIRNKERSEFDAYIEAENKKLEDKKAIILGREKELTEALVTVDKRDKESLLREEETKIMERKVKIKIKNAEMDA